jgi:uncharacterized protein
MKVRIHDLQSGQRDFKFDLPLELVNTRVSGLSSRSLSERAAHSESALPEYQFSKEPKANLHVSLESSTVFITGEIEGQFSGQCARCLEEVSRSLKVPVQLVLKPASDRPPANHPSARGPDIDPDLNFGFYTGDDVDLAESILDFLLLALPFTLLCKEDCRGLCISCGKNLNIEQCDCASKRAGDERFSVFRELKIQ